MKIWSDSFKNGAAIPGEFAFAVRDPATKVRLSSNKNPHLAWSEVPAGTESLVLLCIDGDAPTDGSNVNKEGATLPASMPRADFYHWALVDIPTTRRQASRHARPHAPRRQRLHRLVRRRQGHGR
jgi:phosphatidylethanolamine-binding protein (PEBP) family uncharacterized protein